MNEIEEDLRESMKILGIKNLFPTKEEVFNLINDSVRKNKTAIHRDEIMEKLGIKETYFKGRIRELIKEKRIFICSPGYYIPNVAKREINGRDKNSI